MRILNFIQKNKIKLAKYYVIIFVVFVLLFPLFLILFNQITPAGPNAFKGGEVRNFSTPFVCHDYPGMGDGMANEWYCDGKSFLSNLASDIPIYFTFYIYVFFTNPFLIFLDLIFISLLVFLFVSKRKRIKNEC